MEYLPVNVPIGPALKGTYRLAIQIAQPGAYTAKVSAWKLEARNTHKPFTNPLTVIDASWNVSNALQGGWSVLGSVAIP